MYLQEIPCGGRVLRLKEPLVLRPLLSESGHLLSLEYDELQIDVFAPTREALWAELLEQVRMLWIEYGEAEESELSPPALRFREVLRSRIVLG
ncbi:MAG: hypothetical protein RLY93_11380 [Sumerlaeia bacterium]